MKKAIKVFSLLIVICSLLTIVTCSSDESDTATISITLSDLPGEAAKAVTVDQLQHVIILSGPADSQTLTITGSGTATATVVVGTWSIRVTAYYEEEVYAVGNATAVVRARQNTEVSVHMTVVYKDPGSGTKVGGGGGPGNTGPGIGTGPGTTKSNGADLSGPPTETARTRDSITVEARLGTSATPGQQVIEYAYSSIATETVASLESKWQISQLFSGLTEFETYYFYARSQENEDYLAGTFQVSDPIIAGDITKTWAGLSSAIGTLTAGATATFLLQGDYVVGDGGVNEITIDTNKTITLLPFGDVQIMRNTSPAYTGNFFTIDVGTLTLGKPGMGGSILLNGGNFTVSGVLIQVGLFTASAYLSMYDNVTLKNNEFGAVSISNVGKFEMFGGTIKENTAYQGGGVSSSSGTFNMKGGTIGPTNKAISTSTGGGGVCMLGGSFTMSDGLITGNEAEMGGGVYLSGSGSLEMTGNAEISGNKAISSASACGGGVYVNSGTDSLYMHSGTPKINNNIAENPSSYNGQGGGVFLAGGTTFTMDAGEINGNTAKGVPAEGGGVYVGAGTTFTMNAGDIKGNTADGSPGSKGGGVYVAAVGGFTKTGGEINGHMLGVLARTPDQNAVLDSGTIISSGPGPGHAVYVYDTTPFGVNGTTEATLDSSSSGNPGWTLF